MALRKQKMQYTLDHFTGLAEPPCHSAVANRHVAQPSSQNFRCSCDVDEHNSLEVCPPQTYTS